MKFLNEKELLETLRELDVPEWKIKEIVDRFKGKLIYFRKKIVNKELKKRYARLIRVGYTRQQAVEMLEREFELPKYRVMRITRGLNGKD
ncbi:MAG: hypothetical protein C6I01_01820 [Epsilonproteobacteria bacterium]|nr:hypothetical protein [Campylobacterota bacterium]